MVSGETDRRLSRTRILEVALKICDSEGLPSLTMRRLAADLGVGVMSLYRYVATKDDLLEGVVHLALQPLSMPDDGDWDVRLASAIGRLYAALREHPGATQALAGGFIPGPALDPVRDELLGILLDAGFDAARAVAYLHTLFTYAVGFAIVAGHNNVPDAAESARIASLPPQQFPSLARVAPEFDARFSRPSFESGLALIIDGLRVDLRSR